MKMILFKRGLDPKKSLDIGLDQLLRPLYNIRINFYNKDKCEETGFCAKEFRVGQSGMSVYLDSPASHKIRECTLLFLDWKNKLEEEHNCKIHSLFTFKDCNYNQLSKELSKKIIELIKIESEKIIK